MTLPRILSIAGSDSGGGAGIQADIKTITMMGGHAMTAVTAVTAQNSIGVYQIMTMPPDLVRTQIDAVSTDIGVDAVKIGMIGSIDTARMIGEAAASLPQIVFDPVMIATSGAVLTDHETMAHLDGLMRQAALITPNGPELAMLTGSRVATERDQQAAAHRLSDRYGSAVLAKGGHISGEMLVDLLVLPGGETFRWEDPRIVSRHDHGTGCTLSSAIACGLGAGLELVPAITRGRTFVRAALEAAPELGRGRGPMGQGLGRSHFP